jgi:hypothetical protein
MILSIEYGFWLKSGWCIRRVENEKKGFLHLILVSFVTLCNCIFGSDTENFPKQNYPDGAACLSFNLAYKIGEFCRRKGVKKFQKGAKKSQNTGKRA